ncbi:conserved hypothetical protein [Theileria orientalis strain Shintoku]|uniref:YGGT family protein n=1 Tax=Theileria orientalis strain Shintoku TaxID=869250 RepID=J4DPP0_THEOR|nr:conserved hypothetical protein [Theileria orientalis strain Shintoku]PVC50629.1 hypothetical protein MACL_00002142 [Theileria orientalis]BAM41039.1 conserved hypothetical protein [Theileria orientalis strain Shintoku]|eukprot:XP_009691340.1 conserved hypothetical protein [Theileria orientalis strain Shintoku]
MISFTKISLFFIILYFKHNLAYCFISNYNLHPLTNTFNSSNFKRENRRKVLKYVAEQVYKDHNHGSIHLKALEAPKSEFFRRINHFFSDAPESGYTQHRSQTHIVQSNTFRDALVANTGTLIMVMIYLIKIYRLLLFARFLMDSLTNINPFLPPFSFIYETTNFYTKLVESFPTVMGVNVFSDIPWFILNNIDNYLTSLITHIN